MPSTVNPEEISRFSKLAATWWDPAGPMRPLHRLNPARLSYLERAIENHFHAPLKTLSILDVGCAAGLVSEALALKGAAVTGIDASADLIEAAKAHAKESGAEPNYRNATLEDLAKKKDRFDVVLALEVIEHTADAEAFVALCRTVMKKNGLVIFSTLNRTPKSFLLGIVGAEYILRWLPVGTHDWRRFIKPSELAALAEKAGLTPKEFCGLAYNPLMDHFTLRPRDLDVNYFMVAA